jgi:hypothetical protein
LIDSSLSLEPGQNIRVKPDRQLLFHWSQPLASLCGRSV